MKRICSLCKKMMDDEVEVEGVRGAVGNITGSWVCALCRHGRLQYSAGV